MTASGVQGSARRAQQRGGYIGGYIRLRGRRMLDTMCHERGYKETGLMEPTAEITHRTLKNEQGRVFREIDACGVLAVRNRDRIDGILMSPSAFADLTARAGEAVRMRAALPLLLAAAASGIAIPSETFETLQIPGRYDWEALSDLMARFPVQITHGEDGALLPDLSGVELRHEPVAEDDEELIVAD